MFKSIFNLLCAFVSIILPLSGLMADPSINIGLISPSTICSTGNDSIQYSVIASEIPANTNIVFYQSTDSTFNPYLGEGDSIGYIKGDTIERNSLPFTSCVDIIGIFIDACNPNGIPEYHNEYMFLNSGNGFLVDSLKVDLPNNSGTGNGDINMGTSGCTFIKPSNDLMDTLRKGACSTNFIAAGPSDFVPAHAIVLLFASNNVDYPYNFDNLCQGGVPIYVMQNSCTRVSGAFVNDANCTNSRYRTTNVYYESCASQLTYDRCGLPNQDGSYAVNNHGDTASVANGGIKNNAVDYCNGISFDSLEIRKDTLTLHLNKNFCNQEYYIKGIINPHGSQPISNTINYQLICNEVTANAEKNAICNNDSVIININSTNSSAVNSWTVNANSSISGAVSGTGNSIRQLIHNSGNTSETVVYSISSTVGNCVATTDISITVQPDLALSILGDTSACFGTTVQLTATGQFDSLRWNTNQNSQSIEVIQAGTYSVTAFQSLCSVSASTTVNFTELPIAFNLGNDTTFCDSVSLNLQTGDQTTTWSTGEVGTQIHVSKPGTYIATITNNCGISSDTINIELIDNCGGEVWIPNAFTPNSDGINDVFMVRSDGNITIESFKIYDRWGICVFSTENTAPNDPTSGWNGKYKNKEMPAEVYGYYVVVRYQNGDKKTLKGNVTLLK